MASTKLRQVTSAHLVIHFAQTTHSPVFKYTCLNSLRATSLFITGTATFLGECGGRAEEPLLLAGLALARQAKTRESCLDSSACSSQTSIHQRRLVENGQRLCRWWLRPIGSASRQNNAVQHPAGREPHGAVATSASCANIWRRGGNHPLAERRTNDTGSVALNPTHSRTMPSVGRASWPCVCTA